MMYQHDFNTLAKAFARARVTGQPAILVLAEELQNKYPSFNPVKFMDTYEQELYRVRYAQEKKQDRKGQQKQQKNETAVTGTWVRSRNRKKVSIQV